MEKVQIPADESKSPLELGRSGIEQPSVPPVEEKKEQSTLEPIQEEKKEKENSASETPTNRAALGPRAADPQLSQLQPMPSPLQLQPLQQVTQNITESDLLFYRKYIIIVTGLIVGVVIFFAQYLW